MVVSTELREIDHSEVATHNDEGSAWIIMNDTVYDVTKFLMEHPGGEEVILQQAGRDATDAFNEVGHSADAIEMAKDYVIGKLSNVHLPDGNAAPASPAQRGETTKETWADVLLSPTWSNFLIPVGISVVVYFSYKVINHAIGRVHSG